MAKEDDNLSPEERKARRDRDWSNQKRKKNARVDSKSDNSGYHSKKWEGKNKKDKT